MKKKRRPTSLEMTVRGGGRGVCRRDDEEKVSASVCAEWGRVPG